LLFDISATVSYCQVHVHTLFVRLHVCRYCRVPGRRPRLNVYYEGESAEVSYLLEKLMIGYDKRLRPNYKGNV